MNRKLIYFVGIPISLLILMCSIYEWRQLKHSEAIYQEQIAHVVDMGQVQPIPNATRVLLLKINSNLPEVVLGSGILTSLLVLAGFILYVRSRQSKAEVEHLAVYLQRILDTVNEGFITMDKHSNIIYMNRYAEKLLGWKLSELYGKRIQDYAIPQRYRQEHFMEIDKYLKSHESSMMNREIEFIAINKAGHEFPVEVIFFPVKEGNTLQFHAFVKDISIRRKEELDKARLAGIIDSSEDAIVSADLTGQILTWNPGAERLFGYGPKEVVGKKISIVYPQPEVLESILDQLKAGKHLNIETTRKHKNGTVFPVSVIISPIKNRQGKIIAGSSITRDITERKKVEKMKNEFISIVSHELRTPLTAIRGSLGILESGQLIDLNEKADKLLKIANTNCERLIRLINDMLDLEKIEAGKMNFNFKQINLYNLVTEAIDSTQGLAEKNNIKIVLTGNKDIIVNADQDRIIQVVMNLLSNAIIHAPLSSEIHVSVTKEIRYARVAVTDQGLGVPKDFRDKIFGKFTQADSSDTRKAGGTGLGLNISKVIIEKHHGKIDYISTEGKGSTFYFDLPLSSLTTNTNHTLEVSGHDE